MVTAVSAEARSASAASAAAETAASKGGTEVDHQSDNERGDDDVGTGSDDVRRELHPLLFPYVLL